MTYHLELTITKSNGRKDYDFIISKADSKEQAIQQETNCLIARIEKARSGNQIMKSYVDWVNFELV